MTSQVLITSLMTFCNTQLPPCSMKGFLDYIADEVVSQEFVHCPYSSIFDSKAGIQLNTTFVKVVLGMTTSAVTPTEWWACLTTWSRKTKTSSDSYYQRNLILTLFNPFRITNSTVYKTYYFQYISLTRFFLEF